MSKVFYKTAKIAIDEDLTIHPLSGFDGFTQNSIGTQIISATLSGWELEDGAVIMFGFEKISDAYNFTVEPILASIDFENNTYWAKVPKEVMLVSGEWNVTIYKKWGFNTETGFAEKSLPGEAYTFTVKNTTVDENGANITIADMAAAIETYKSLNKKLIELGYLDLNSKLIYEKEITVDDWYESSDGTYKYNIPIEEHSLQKIYEVIVQKKESGIYENILFSYELTSSVLIILDEPINARIIIKGE